MGQKRHVHRDGAVEVRDDRAALLAGVELGAVGPAVEESWMDG